MKIIDKFSSRQIVIFIKKKQQKWLTNIFVQPMIKQSMIKHIHI